MLVQALVALLLISGLSTPMTAVQDYGQYVQIVSYSGAYVQFVAKPDGATHVMTYNCTVECFSARANNTVVVMVENQTVIRANFTGFYWSHDLMLPPKRKVDVIVVLNGIRYVFHLLLTRRAPTPEELKLAEKLIMLTPKELELVKWEAVGKASLGWVVATVLGYLVARWRKRSKIQEW